MAKELYNTPNLDELENGPLPSFVPGLKRLAQDDHDGASMVKISTIIIKPIPVRIGAIMVLVIPATIMLIAIIRSNINKYFRLNIH
jgi:hypothetical protein